MLYLRVQEVEYVAVAREGLDRLVGQQRVLLQALPVVEQAPAKIRPGLPSL